MITKLLLSLILLQMNTACYAKSADTGVVTPPNGVVYTENRASGELKVVAEDGTQFVFDFRNHRQYVLSPKGRMVSRWLDSEKRLEPIQGQSVVTID
jgi:hypothetical protein